MTRAFKKSVAILLAALACASFSANSAATSQEGPHPAPRSSSSDAQTADDPHAEIRKLFAEIETHLASIDRMLIDAAADSPRGTPVDGPAKASDAVSETLVTASRKKSRTVVDDLDRILSLADHPHPRGST
jgi:hypothetical protein